MHVRRSRIARAALIFVPIAVLAMAVAITVPASARQEQCPAQPTPYSVTLSVTLTNVEVGDEVEIEVSATDAAGAPVTCGVAVVRVSGGGSKPARASAGLQELEWAGAVILRLLEPMPIEYEEPGDYDLSACVEQPDGTDACSSATQVTAFCDVYGTEGVDSISRYTPQLSIGINTFCLLGGNDTFSLQDDLDAPDQQRSVFVSGGDGDDYMSWQYVTGAGSDERPYHYTFIGGGGDDQTGRGVIDLQRFSGYVPPTQVGDWTWPAFRPPRSVPGNDTLRLPVLGGSGIGGPGNDVLLGGENGPNHLSGQWESATFPDSLAAGAWRAEDESAVAAGYLHLDLPDFDTITGGDRADVVEGGSDDDNITLGNGTDGGVGDVWLFPNGRMPFLDNVRFGNDVINVGSNPPDGPLEEFFGDTFAGGVFVGRFSTSQDGSASAEGGDDTLIGGGGEQKLDGQAGNDKLTGGAGDDKLLGGAGSDVLKGSAGSDVLSAGAGQDVLDGGKGDDRCAGGTGQDKQSGC